MKKTLIVTNIPSYHQVDLFNELAKTSEISLTVFYLVNKTIDRHWEEEFQITHKHKFLKTSYVFKNRGLYYNKGVLKEIRKVNPDTIVLTQYANISQQIILYFYWLFIKNVKLIFWSEKPGIPFYEVPIIKNNFLRKKSRYLALIPVLKNENISIWGIGKKAVAYYSKLVKSTVQNYPYFLDTTRFRSSEKRNFTTKLRILYAGKFNERKGFDILLEFLETTDFNFIDNFEFTIIGTGENKERVEQLAEKYNNINYIGFVERQVMPKYYGANDIFLFPGRYDGWGMVINEAMANGLIVVSTPFIGAVEDVIIDKENGLIINGNLKSIKPKLEWILANKNKLPTISENAKITSKKNDVVEGSKLFLKLISNDS